MGDRLTLRHPALVLGGAKCVWDDLEAALSLGEYDAVVACNDAIASYSGHLAAAVSLHPIKLPKWLADRARRGFPAPRIVAAHRVLAGAPCINRVTDYRWPRQRASGSSGLFAVKVALELGFERVVVCGVPMEATQAHFFDKKPAPWRAAPTYRAGWTQARERLVGKVKSMSGWTAEQFGRPDAQWLA